MEKREEKNRNRRRKGINPPLADRCGWWWWWWWWWSTRRIFWKAGEEMGRRGQARGEKRGAFSARISSRESPWLLECGPLESRYYIPGSPLLSRVSVRARIRRNARIWSLHARTHLRYSWGPTNRDKRRPRDSSQGVATPLLHCTCSTLSLGLNYCRERGREGRGGGGFLRVCGPVLNAFQNGRWRGGGEDVEEIERERFERRGMIDEAFRRIMADLGRLWEPWLEDSRMLIAGRMWVIGLEKPLSFLWLGEKRMERWKGGREERREFEILDLEWIIN